MYYTVCHCELWNLHVVRIVLGDVNIRTSHQCIIQWVLGAKYVLLFVFVLMSTEFISPVVLNVHPLKKSGNKSYIIEVGPYKVYKFSE